MPKSEMRDEHDAEADADATRHVCIIGGIITTPGYQPAPSDYVTKQILVLDRRIPSNLK